MGHIQRHHLSDAKVAVPGPSMPEALDAILGPIVDRIWRLRVESRTLATLRDALLPKLVSGEIRLTKAD